MAPNWLSDNRAGGPVQSRTVQSSPPVASTLPSGLNATALTVPVWSDSGDPRGVSELTTQACRGRHQEPLTFEITVV